MSAAKIWLKVVATEAGESSNVATNCNKVGHISHDCPECAEGAAEAMPTQLLMQGMEDLVTNNSYQFAQYDGHLPASWIILNTGSTINIFLN